MTAFASRTGTLGTAGWQWEMRGVNGRGLDLRLRCPDGLDGVEPALRKALTERLSRGNVSVTLKLWRDEAEAGVTVDAAHLDRVLQALEQVQERAFALGVTLGQPTAADVLAQRGILTTAETKDDTGAVSEAIIADIAPLIGDFVAMRAQEGAAMADVISAQLTEIADLTTKAAEAAKARAPKIKAAMQAALAHVVEAAPDASGERVAQELALIAVKSDVTEEIDRLGVHVAAARALLAQGDPTGRKLDFLAQEFNREANTLCSKAQDSALTAIGLDLKAVIDQMREQIQNVE
ncbi:MAG: YicC/YloC family endoribonuclease [Pseudomonadota bacterium]